MNFICVQAIMQAQMLHNGCSSIDDVLLSSLDKKTWPFTRGLRIFTEFPNRQTQRMVLVNVCEDVCVCVKQEYY